MAIYNFILSIGAYLRRLLTHSGSQQEDMDPVTRPQEAPVPGQHEENYSAQQRPDALSNSTISVLPVEILEHIMHYLPAESAVVFSLSCVPLYNILGNQHFEKARSSKASRLALLLLLAQDIPDQIACAPCGRLHGMKNLLRYSGVSYSNEDTTARHSPLQVPRCVDRDNARDYVVSDLFGTTAFEMALKRYHQQPECEELLNTMSSQEARSNVVGDYIWHRKEDYCIFQGRLILRQRSVYIPRKLENATDRSIKFYCPSHAICAHIRISTIALKMGQVHRCQDCRTECRIDLDDYEADGWVMFLNVWKDLGRGDNSETWKQHIPVLFAKLLSRSFYMVRTTRYVWSGQQELSSAFGDCRFDSLLELGNEAN